MSWHDEYRAFLAASWGTQEQTVGRLAETIAAEAGLAVPCKLPGVDAMAQGLRTEIKAKILRSGVSLATRYVGLSALNVENAELYLLFIMQPHRPSISVYSVSGVEMHPRLTKAHKVSLGFLRNVDPALEFTEHP